MTLLDMKPQGQGWQQDGRKSNYPLNHCSLRHQNVLRIVLFQRSIQPDPRKKKSNPIRAQNSATLTSENAITPPVLSLQPTASHSGCPSSPRRSCPRKQRPACCAGRCRCTESQGSCYWAWATAPGGQEEVARCCCFCRLRAVRWLSTRHHTGQSDLYCWTLGPERRGVSKGGFANLSFRSLCFTLRHLELIVRDFIKRTRLPQPTLGD